MYRRLKFDESSKHHFLFIYEGFLAGGNVAKDGRTGDVKRRERTIIKALKAISVENEAREPYPGSEEHPRELALTGNGPVELELEQASLDLLVRYMESVPWNMVLVDKAMDAVDFVTAADKV
jgi:hypothetical protein